MIDRHFTERFQKILGSWGGRSLTLNEAIEEWEHLIEQCEGGYDWDIYEFENDLAIRDLLENVLRDYQLSLYPELKRIAERVNRADERFRRLLLRSDEGERWWSKAILRCGGKEYADDVGRLYGIPVEVMLDDDNSR